MQATYLVIKYNHSTGKEETVSVHTDKFNAINEIQSIIIDYLQTNDGAKKISTENPVEKYIRNIKRKSWKALKNESLGHYVIVDTEDHIHKWTVCRVYNKKKVSKGYFGKSEYSVPDVEKVFDLDIVSVPFVMFNEMFNLYRMKCFERYIDDMTIGSECTLWDKFTRELSETKTFSSLKEKVDAGETITMNTIISPEEKMVYIRKTPTSTCTYNKSEESMHMSIIDKLVVAAVDGQDIFKLLEKDIEESIPVNTWIGLKRPRNPDL